jgi:hypothetical protein
MTVTLEIPPERVVAIQAAARLQGLSVEAWLVQLAEQSAPGESFAHLQITDPEEWSRRFQAWLDSRRNLDLPVLSDEAMSRDSIYPD